MLTVVCLVDGAYNQMHLLLAESLCALTYKVSMSAVDHQELVCALGQGFWAGADEAFNNPNFHVSLEGRLTAKAGNIGGWFMEPGIGFYSGDV